MIKEPVGLWPGMIVAVPGRDAGTPPWEGLILGIDARYVLAGLPGACMRVTASWYELQGDPIIDLSRCVVVTNLGWQSHPDSHFWANEYRNRDNLDYLETDIADDYGVAIDGAIVLDMNSTVVLPFVVIDKYSLGNIICDCH